MLTSTVQNFELAMIYLDLLNIRRILLSTMTETERSLIIPKDPGFQPDIRRLMPNIGEEPATFSMFPENLGGMTGIVVNDLLLHRFASGISETQIAALIAHLASSGQVEIPESDDAATD